MDKPDPDGLVTVAGQLLAENKTTGAFSYYKKAANLYMESGSYFKVFEVFKIMTYIYKEQGKLGEMIQLVLETARKLEDFKVFDVAARMYENAGTLCYDLADYENASAYYQNASDLYLSLWEENRERDGSGDDARKFADDMRKLSGILLIKSAEATYHVLARKDKSESLMLEGIFRICALAEQVPSIETTLVLHMKRGNFLDARNMASNLAKAFKEANEKLHVTREFNVELLSANVKSRVLHYQAEYLFISYLITRKLEGEEKAAAIAKEVLSLLLESMGLMRGIFAKEHDREDIERYCFDGMLHAVISALLKKKPEPVDFQDRLHGDIIRAINESAYYKIMVTIIGPGLKQAELALMDANLGKLERMKGTLMKLIFAEGTGTRTGTGDNGTGMKN
ncbi:MAG: hypothetical protein GYA24_07095 [Candidatus Lokiarchaeota archaeon]|nr:hypothetical protein [Candidatus Lokiarchaeota archaeon]